MRITPRLVVLAAILAASCGGARGLATAPSPTPPSDGAIPWSPRLASPTPTPVPTPALAPCRVADVTSTFDRWGAAAGSIGGSIRLAPTAAVCGTPADAAMELIRELEGMDRGRYTGPVGWVDSQGNGEWGIALRCGEIDGPRARLFAGGGIVAGSDPAAELAEAQLKLRPMQYALEG